MFVVSVIVSAFLNCVFTPFVFAEERTYEGVGEYVMSDFETPDIAKQRAKSRAEQNAVEQAGAIRHYVIYNNSPYFNMTFGG